MLNQLEMYIYTGSPIKSPAIDFGWHDPGYIHSAVMTGLHPLTTYSYRYGRFTYSFFSTF